MCTRKQYIAVLTALMRNHEEVSKILQEPGSDEEMVRLGVKYEGCAQAFCEAIRLLECDSYYDRISSLVKEWEI